jgi:GNAT superfamily N-acetyltransferase
VIAAIESNLRACFASFAALPNAVARAEPGHVVATTDVPIDFFNGAVGARFGSDVDARIDETLAPFRERGVPMRWWLGPSAAPAGLGSRLVARGMRHARECPGMALEMASLGEPPAAPRGFRVDEVRDRALLDRWVATFGAGFGRAPWELAHWTDAYVRLGLGADDAWQHYLGAVDGEAVATASLLVDGDVGGLYHIVTLPAWRGRGIGAAITRHAVDDARRRGCRVAVLQSSAMGAPVYERVGFRALCRLDMYVWRPAALGSA